MRDSRLWNPPYIGVARQLQRDDGGREELLPGGRPPIYGLRRERHPSRRVSQSREVPLLCPIGILQSM
jgi:hypothetical protein